MNIRRFFAPDMRRAIQLVRKEHGADAVILSSRTIDGGMEIISAVDYDEALIAMLNHSDAEQCGSSAAEASPAARPEAVQAAAVDGAQPAAGNEAVVPAWSQPADGRAEAVNAQPASSGTARSKPARAKASGSKSEADSGSSKPRKHRLAKVATVRRQEPHMPTRPSIERVSAHPGTARPAAGRTAGSAPTDQRKAARAAAHSDGAVGRSPGRHAEACETPSKVVMPPSSTRSRNAAETGEFAGWSAAKAGWQPPKAAAWPAQASQVPSPIRQVAEDPGLTAIREELGAMKYMLSEQFAQLSRTNAERLDPDRAVLSGRVAQLGLDSDLTETLVAEVEEPGSPSAWREIMLGLARRLRVPKSDPLDEGGVFAFVGPTGVGKTTTIAKLAARHCMRYGRDSLALISTDTVRVGAHRQLDAYGAILGTPVRLASDATELARLLYTLRDRRLVLIDTAGMASRDSRIAQTMRQLEAGRSVKQFLVLSANMQTGAMNDAVRAFGGKRLAGSVLSKLDETEGLGPALSVLVRQRLSAVWLSHGQQVPEDLRLASGLHLLRWAFPQPVPKPAAQNQSAAPAMPRAAMGAGKMKERLHAGF